MRLVFLALTFFVLYLFFKASALVANAPLEAIEFIVFGTGTAFWTLLLMVYSIYSKLTDFYEATTTSSEEDTEDTEV